MAYTDAENLANLKEILGTGVLTVTQNGKTVTYRSDDEIRREIARLEAATSSTYRKKRNTYARVRRRG